VIVISGDHPLTVGAIAREVGILRGAEPRILTGAEIESWSDAALRRALADGEVHFARSAPLDKLRIVEALQATGQVVAVTGDGVNDAPALKRADIGIAMGLSGTDVSREAAGMVLLDDNFATIVAAVEEGRVIYANIRRFVGYVLTSNVPEILPYVAFVLLAIPLPLPVMLILAIDLGTDLAPAIGLAAERAEVDVMTLPPRARTERLLSRGLLLSSYLLWGLIETGAGFAAFLSVLAAGGWRPGTDLGPADPLYGRAVAAFFAAVVICQVANVQVWRTTRESVLRRGLLANRAVVAGIAVEIALLLGIVASPPGHRLFGTGTPPVGAWLAALPFALGMLVLSEILKARARRRAG
jgi:sodium/potassium-transporting ATPase subunit alpha